MKLRAFMMLGLGALVFAGCQNNNKQQAAQNEEPYTPSYTSLDSMDAASTSDTTTYEPPADPAVNTTNDTTDEPLDPAGGQVYTVRKGDTFYSLARRFYSDQARWRDIWETNKNRVPDPDKLSVGVKLIIP